MAATNIAGAGRCRPRIRMAASPHCRQHLPGDIRVQLWLALVGLAHPLHQLAGSDVFQQVAVRPARIAGNILSSSPKLVRISTSDLGLQADILAVASTPPS